MPEESGLPRRCIITIDIADGVQITWVPPLPDEPHRMNWVEAAAAEAIVAIGGAVTGRNRRSTLAAVKAFTERKEATLVQVLLAALKFVLQRHGGDCGDHCTNSCEWCVARAAVAKARDL